MGVDPRARPVGLGPPARGSAELRRPRAARARRGYDEDLADRIRALLEELGVGVREQKMFGGLAFLVNGHMAVAASGQGGLLLGVDPDDSATLLRKPHTSLMEMRGREMAGWIRVSDEGVGTKRQLLGEHDANLLMSEFPSVEADELVTKQFVRAELAEVRTELAEALHRQTVWLGGAIVGATALLAAIGTLT